MKTMKKERITTEIHHENKDAHQDKNMGLKEGGKGRWNSQT